MQQLRPIRTGQTLFDVWTVCHFAVWVVGGFDLYALGVAFLPALLIVYTLAALWEVFEHTRRSAPRCTASPL